jgi:hypothetical protein
MVEWLRNTVAAERKINLSDLDLFCVTDEPTEAVRIVAKNRRKKPADKERVRG